MSNIDTTIPISEFNVVGADGNVTAVPLSAGQKLYQHIVQFTTGNISIITRSNEIFTTDTLKQYFRDLGVGDSFSNRYFIRNVVSVSEIDATISIYASMYVEGSTLYYRGIKYTPTIVDGVLDYTATAISPSAYVYKDTVIEL